MFGKFLTDLSLGICTSAAEAQGWLVSMSATR